MYSSLDTEESIKSVQPPAYFYILYWKKAQNKTCETSSFYGMLTKKACEYWTKENSCLVKWEEEENSFL